MSYLELINHFWKLNKENTFSAMETQLYFKLLDTCNSLNWKNPFTHSNGYICGELGITEKTLIRSRQNLKEFGLIDFRSGQIKRQITEYLIPGAPCEAELKAAFYKRQQADAKIYGGGPNIFNPGDSRNGCKNSSLSDSLNGSLNNSLNGNQSDSLSDSLSGSENPDILRVNRKDIDEEENFKEPDGSSSTDDDPEVTVNYVFNQYNSICKNVTRAKALSEARRKMIGARLREHGYKAVMEMLIIASKSDFMSGANKRSWVANIDWMFKPTNFVKVLDGIYNNRPSGATTDNFYARPSNLEIIEETYNNLMADERYSSCR